MTTKKRIPNKRPTKNSPAKRPPAGAQTGAGGSTARPSGAAAPKPPTAKSSGGRAVCAPVGAPPAEDTAEKTATSEAATSPVTTASGASPSQSNGLSLPLAARAVLDALSAPTRAAVLLSLLAWTHTLSLLARLVAERNVTRERAEEIADDATSRLCEGTAVALDADTFPAVSAVVAANYGDAPGVMARYVAHGNTSAAELAPFAADLDALIRAPAPHSPSLHVLRLPLDGPAPPVITPIGDMPDDVHAIQSGGRLFVRAAPPRGDLRALLRDVMAFAAARVCDGELCMAAANAERLVAGEAALDGGERPDTFAPDALADALAFVVVDLRRSYKNAARMFRDAYAAHAASERNDPPAEVARVAQYLRDTRRDLARVAALAGRMSSALSAAEPGTSAA